jgi:hypothetical protein
MSLIAVPKDATTLDVLAQRYRAAWDKMQGGREQWIDAVLEFSAVVLEAREKYPSNQDYNRWITRNQLQHLHPNELRAHVGIGRRSQKNLAAMRKLLEENIGLSMRTIWEKKYEKPISPFLEKRGTPQRSNRSNLPQDPRPERKAVILKGLTREQVDPDFKGTALEFATKYGHVNLHTKQQIEHNKRQEALMAWLGAVTEHARTANTITALPCVDPATLREWIGKPGKAEKLKAWCKSIRSACESLHSILGEDDGKR